MESKISFFMGANSPAGFVSLFDDLYNPKGTRRCYIIKGGPGTGKSRLMKKIAAAAETNGLACEYIYCASDPDSLDAVIIPELDLCLADGTSPHVIEPRYPGATEQIINLGDCWDEKLLSDSRAKIVELTDMCSHCHKRCIRYLHAAGSLRTDIRLLASRYVNNEKIQTYASRFASREFPSKSETGGAVTHRFLSAVTPKGVIAHGSTVSMMCKRVIGIDDEHYCASGVLLNELKEHALNRGLDVICCPCPLDPYGNPEHLIIPSLSLAFVTLREHHPFNIVVNRVVHVSRFTDNVGLSAHKNRITFVKKAYGELIDEAARLMAQAKGIHDELEDYYIAAMDFSAVNRMTDALRESFGLPPTP